VFSATDMALLVARLDRSTDPAERQLLNNAYDLVSHVKDAALAEPDRTEALVSRAVGQLIEDGWLRVDYDRWPGDEEVPPAFRFASQHLQRCHNLRLTGEGWQAVRAMQAAAEPKSTPPKQVSAPAAAVPPPQRPEPRERDFFISHASEDKAAAARLLADALRDKGYSVWLDEFEFQVGDGLHQKIDEGLAASRYGVVILSHHFFRKSWPRSELDALATREANTGVKVILPVWHEIGADEVADYSQLLAGRYATSTAKGIAEAAEDLIAALEAQPASAINTAEDAGAAGPAFFPAADQAAVNDLLDELATLHKRVARALEAGHYPWDFELPAFAYHDHKNKVWQAAREALRDVYVTADDLNTQLHRRESNGCTVLPEDDLPGLLRAIEHAELVLRGGPDA
jgi:TIR domain